MKSFDTTPQVRIAIIDARQSRVQNPLKGIMWSAGAAAVFFGPGLMFDSPAMQWAGFALFFFLMATLAVLIAVSAVADKMTIEEARERLDRLEISPQK